MKKKTSLLLMLVFIMLCMTGCSSVPKEKQIKQDIMDASSSLVLAENEKVVDIEIKDRKTDKKAKSDQVICIVKTELDNVSYEKGYTLSYHKFDNGWKMQSIIIGESADWVIKPLKGVNEEQIKNSLTYKTINVDGELWTIEDGEISDIVIKKQDTDLDKGKDKVTIKIKLNGEVEEVEGTIKAEYDFDKKWELKDMEDENDFSSKEKADKALNVTDKAVETVQMMSAKMEKNYSVIEMADKKKDSSSSDGTETQDDSKSKEDSDKKTQKDSKSKEDDDKKTRNDSKLKEGSSEETQDDSKSKESDNEDPEKEEPESEYDFGKAFEETIDDVTISGDMGVDLEVELMLDINHGNIKYGMAMYRKAGANLSVDLKESMSKEHEKQLFEKKLPNYTFVVAGVPIVITNQLESNLTGKIGIEGNWNMSLSWLDEQTVGFIYDSKTNKVKEIKDPKEQKDISDGIEWSTIASAKGDASAGIDIHLITKLYGTCGGDISAGIFGNASGEVSLSNREDQYYAGTVNLSIVPNLTGKLVVDLPLVSEELMEVEIFNKDLPAIWEKEWKSSWKPEDDLNYSDTGEQWNLYKTRYGEVNNVPATEFQFKIPFGWNVESEGVSDGLTGVDGVSEIEEKVVLSNERGVTVTFWSLTHELGGRSGVSMLQADITKADDSEFVPGFPDGTNTDFSTLGNFIVAKVHIIGELDMKRDSDFTPVDSGATFYAVVPESYLGTREFVGQAGNVDEFSFDYPTPYAFIAEAPDGTFTASEERDVVKILKSFKVAE